MWSTMHTRLSILLQQNGCEKFHEFSAGKPLYLELIKCEKKSGLKSILCGGNLEYTTTKLHWSLTGVSLIRIVYSSIVKLGPRASGDEMTRQ